MLKIQVKKCKFFIIYPSMSSLPNFILNPWLFLFSLPVQDIFCPQKPLSYFTSTTSVFWPRQWWRLWNGLSYFQSNCSWLCKEYNIISSASSSFETVLGFKIHIKVRFDDQIQPSHLCNRDSPCGGKWRLNLSLPISPNFGAASSPSSCANSAEQGKEKWTELKSVTSRISSALTPMPWQRQEKKRIYKYKFRRIEELNPHYNNFFFQ